ncbi:hypothetical protein B0H14DRAFT_3514769 [Mycena olivaceomarginata]|nr:hypothetical protein B0H14DRAFT_3514769 [Mycena olivaceomarginata]
MPPLGTECCIPNYWAEPGHEDPVAFCAQGNWIHVVMSGTVRGCFSSEARARKQIDGVPNARWRSVISWAQAIEIWNVNCDAYHQTKCPRPSQMSVLPPRQLAQSPANELVTSASSRSRPRARARSARKHTVTTAISTHSTPQSPVLSTGLQVPSTPKSLPRARVPRVPVSSADLQAPSTPKSLPRARIPQAPDSPLAMMDAVDAFSRMGVADPSVSTRPPKQWVIGGVSKFFAQRINAIDHILTLHLGQASLKESRNVHKLRAFINGVEYVWKPGHAWDTDEEQ